MSTYFHAAAIIGCAVPAESLFRTVNRSTCTHTLPDGAVLCPVCGKPVHSEREAIYINGRLGALHVVASTDEQHFIVGPVYAWTNDTVPERAVIPDDIPALREQTRAVLEPMGLWEESAFGLWAVPYMTR